MIGVPLLVLISRLYHCINHTLAANRDQLRVHARRHQKPNDALRVGTASLGVQLLYFGWSGLLQQVPGMPSGSPGVPCSAAMWRA